MKKRILFTALFVLLAFALSACGCEHEWSEATCLTAKTCVKCEETEGEPLGHSFAPATCTDPQTCSSCGATEGEALGHTPGNDVTSTDYINAKLCREQLCSRCSQVLTHSEEDMTTLIQDEMFTLSPREFMDRLSALLKPIYPNFRYFVNTEDTLTVELHLEGVASTEHLLNFFSDPQTPLTRDSFDTPGFWCVSLGRGINVSSDTSFQYLEPNLYKVFCQAADPALTEKDMNTLSLISLVTLMNWIDFGEHFGYHEQNGLFYEFNYYCLPQEDLRCDVSTVLIYASNWMKDS